MKNALKTAIIFLLIAISILYCPNCQGVKAAENASQNITTEARAAYLIDAKSGTCIYAKNETQKLPIASMTKLATLAVIFQQVESGNLQLTDQVVVSENAASTEGSSALLDANSKYIVEDLIKTIIVVSANDSCVALAEHLCGSEDLFVKKMNQFASALNLSNTQFKNSTGLPVDGHYSCAKDMAKIYQSICNNKIYQKYATIWMEDFVHPSGRITGLVNTNKLVKFYDGCTGGKTGHTNEAKYCLTASASRNGTSLIAVIIGAENSKSRFAQVSSMFNYWFANFVSQTIVDSSIPQTNIEVVGAKNKQVEVYASEDYCQLCAKDSAQKYKTHLIINDDIKAPLNKDSIIGKILVLDQNNIVQKEIDLIVKTNVEQKGYKQILEDLFSAW